MRDCERPFQNTGGALNPDFRFSPNDSAWRQWQKRIRTCHLNAGRSNSSRGSSGKQRQKQANPPQPVVSQQPFVLPPLLRHVTFYTLQLPPLLPLLTPLLNRADMLASHLGNFFLRTGHLASRLSFPIAPLAPHHLLLATCLPLNHRQ